MKDDGARRRFTDEEVRSLMTGRLYFNPQDTNIIVKRYSGSYTMNFGNVWSWVISAAVAAAVYFAVRLF